MSGEWLAFLPIFLAAAAMLGLAAWLLALDAGRTANRVFAAVLILRAATFILGPARALSHGETAARLTALAPYLIIPLAPLILYLVSIHPRRRGPLAGRAGQWSLVAITVGALAWYTLDPGAHATIVIDDGTHALRAGHGHAYGGFGPLILFTALRLPVMAVAGLVFAMDYVRTPPGSPRHSAFLLQTGFTLNAFFDGSRAIPTMISQINAEGSVHWFPFGWAFVLLPVLTLGIAIAATAVLVHGQLRGPYKSHHGLRFFLYGVALTLLLGFGSSQARAVDLPGAATIVDVVLGLYRLLLPILVTYALLRYSLFDMDVKVKRGVARGAVMMGVVAALSILAESLEVSASTTGGDGFGLVAAAFMALTFRPLERAGRRFADTVLPDVVPIRDQTDEERRRFYREHVRLAREDGRLTAKERHLLLALGQRLGFDADTCRRLEADA